VRSIPVTSSAIARIVATAGAVTAFLALGCGASERPAPSRNPPAPRATAPRATLEGVPRIQRDAAKVARLVRSPLARRFVAATAALPRIAPRTVHRDAAKKRALTAAEAARLPADERATWAPLPIDEEFYYNTKYGSPLAYARPLDLLGEAGVVPEPGTRLFDFGYGGVGHLRLLASLGFDAVGVDVDPLLGALYSEPTDQGAIAGFDGKAGSLRLVHGSYPGDGATARAVGGGFDVIVSKNVLKKGYVHPDRPAEERFLIDLGVDDATFLRTISGALRPGGFFLIYNICPAPTPPDQPFKPWTDGRSPFPPSAFEAAGLRVLAFDRDDTDAIRALGRALGWDRGEGAMDLENDLSVLYTLVERPIPPSPAAGVL
jgi:SAM-dependent methyltransferase